MNPPGHTCPAIDAAQSAFRRLAWRVTHPEHVGVTVAEVVAEGLALLDQVRAENMQLRQACAHRDLIIGNLEGEIKILEQYGNDLRTIYAEATASAQHWRRVAGVEK